MGNSGGRTFWATVDRISNQGNGVVEKDESDHFIVGPVRKEAVGKTVKVRMVGPNKAELVDPELRKDVYANKTESTTQPFSEGDIVSGRILERSAGGVPILKKDGIQVEVPGATLNEEVEVRLENVSESKNPWPTAIGVPVTDGVSSNNGPRGTVISDVELYSELPTTSSGTVVCPVASCKYTNAPASVAAHVSGKRDPQHDWNQLGYTGANEYKRSISTTGHDLYSKTSVLHLSDSHLGASLTKSGDYPSDSPCLKGFSRAIDIAIGREVDAVLNTGDLFHNDRHGIPSTVKEAAYEQLKRLAKHEIPFYSIDGNHERKAGRKVLSEFEREDLVFQLTETPQLVGNGIALYGRDFTSAKEWKATTWSPSPPATDRYGIAAIHQSIEPISNNDRPECTVNDVVETVGPHVHVIAVGNLHRTGIDWEEGLPFVLGGTTEPQRAQQASITPMAGLFIQDENVLRYERVEIPI